MGSPPGSNPLANLLGSYGDDAADDSPRSGGAPAQDTEQAAAVAAGAGPAPSDPLNDQLHDFLSELQSSGLLADGDADGAGGEPGAAGALHAAPGAGASAPASEQRVLGPVEGAGGGWFLVLDAASGRPYYWQRERGEVAWVPPDGAALPPDTAAAAAEAASQPAAAASQQPQPGAAAEAAADGARSGGAGLPCGDPWLAAPSAEVLEAAERVAHECTEAAGALLDDLPRVARLAVEAQALSALLLVLAQAQQAAVDAADAAAAHKWGDLESTMHMALSALHFQLRALPTNGAVQPLSAGAADYSAGDATGAARAASLPRVRSGSVGSGGEERELAAPLPPLPAAAAPAPPAAAASPAHPASPAPPLPPAFRAADHCGGEVPLDAPLPPPLPDERAAHAPRPPGRKRKAAGEAAAGGAKPSRPAGAAATAASGGGKRAASLISKWTAVAKQVAAEEEAAAVAAAAADDPEARAAAAEAQRRREAEQWRLQQLRTGAADANANFAPVLGDWRHRAGLQQQAQPALQPAGKRRRQQGATEASAPADDDMPDLDAESEGLPPGWRAMWDRANRRLYYGNLTTSETQWSRPA